MPLTPFQFLAVLDDAIAAAPSGRKSIALELHAPGGVVLGERGRHLGVDEKGPVFGFTRRQCETLRGIILNAAASDGVAPGTDTGSTYTGDHR